MTVKCSPASVCYGFPGAFHPRRPNASTGARDCIRFRKSINMTSRVSFKGTMRRFIATLGSLALALTLLPSGIAGTPLDCCSGTMCPMHPPQTRDASCGMDHNRPSANLERYDGVRYGLRAPGYTSFTDMLKKTRTAGFGSEGSGSCRVAEDAAAPCPPATRCYPLLPSATHGARSRSGGGVAHSVAPAAVGE